MESKKDIGKLFKDHLEQLDFSPSTKVWEQIELDLNKKKKKRRFFIWFFFSALLVGSLFSGMVHILSDGKSIMEKKIGENSVSNEIGTNDSISRSTKNMETNAAAEGETVNTTSKKNATKNENTTNVLFKNNTTNSKNKQEKITNYKAKLRIAGAKKKQSAKKRSTYGIANSFSKKQRKATKTNPDTTKTSDFETLFDSNNETGATKSNANETTSKQTLIDSLIAESNKTTEASKKDIKEKDSLPIKDSVIDTKAKTKDYEIVIAPYYGLNYGGYFGNFNTLSNNAVLDKKADVSNAYGLLIRWMFGNRFGIQTGAGKINSRYVSTIEKTGSSFINAQNISTDLPINELNNLFINETKVKLTYENTYIEVPLEAYYVILDKKFGVASTFGISMLFGNKNTVFAESENVQKMKIGTLTTNSPTSATLNGKLNLFYKITPSLQFDLYPTFQYQIMGNTDSSNYSNYFFSVRTGLSYKF